MANKKAKGKGKNGGGSGNASGGTNSNKTKEAKNAPKKPVNTNIQLPPQDRVEKVREFWEQLNQDERVSLLTADIKSLLEKAELLDTEAKTNPDGYELLGPPLQDGYVETPLVEVLEEGVARLQDKATWKLWEFTADKEVAQFTDADSFRQYVQEKHLKDDLRKLLPHDEKPVEKPAEAALRVRMTELLQRVQQMQRQMQEEPAPPVRYTRSARGNRGGSSQETGVGVRDGNIDIITAILEALEQEHEYLYHSLLFPVTKHVCELLPHNMRESTGSELYFEDLEKLPADEVARICEWLTEKVDALGAKLKPEAKDQDEEEDDESMGDVDLFMLTEDGKALTVNSKWLQHLQDRLLGDDGHPRKATLAEDPHRMGLVLEWIYGSIVSTAEKARDGAKRAVGREQPTAGAAFDALQQSLHDQALWEARAQKAKELMMEMMGSRREAAELARSHAVEPLPRGDDGQVVMDDVAQVPDEVMLSMLRREALLTRAKLHALLYEQIVAEKQLRSLKAQLRQGEPEFDRLKRELEEVKHPPRGVETAFRSAAEMERHRHQMADAAIEEQLEVQTAFREHGQRLQGIYDKRHRTEMEIGKRESEMKQLQGWKTTVENLIERCEALVAAKSFRSDPSDPSMHHLPATTISAALCSPMSAFGADMLASEDPALEPLLLRSPGSSMSTQQQINLLKLRAHFHKDIRKQLYRDDDDRAFFSTIQNELKQVEKRLEEGRAALQHLEMHLLNVACDDPGMVIGSQVVLPMLQDRLDQRAMEFKAQQAAHAENLLIRMEEEAAAKESAEKERKKAAKQKKAGKQKSEKEKALQEKAAKEVAEKQTREREEKERAVREEEERRKRAEQLEALRKEEEEQMEKRRQELLADSTGYWRQRMAEQLAAEALLQGEDGTSTGEDEAEPIKAAEDTSDQWQRRSSGHFSSSSTGHPQREGGGRRERHASRQEAVTSNGPGSAAQRLPARQQQGQKGARDESSRDGLVAGSADSNGGPPRRVRPPVQQQQQQAGQARVSTPVSEAGTCPPPASEAASEGVTAPLRTGQDVGPQQQQEQPQQQAEVVHLVSAQAGAAAAVAVAAGNAPAAAPATPAQQPPPPIPAAARPVEPPHPSTPAPAPKPNTDSPDTSQAPPASAAAPTLAPAPAPRASQQPAAPKARSIQTPLPSPGPPLSPATSSPSPPTPASSQPAPHASMPAAAEAHAAMPHHHPPYIPQPPPPPYPHQLGPMIPMHPMSDMQQQYVAYPLHPHPHPHLIHPGSIVSGIVPHPSQLPPPQLQLVATPMSAPHTAKAPYSHPATASAAHHPPHAQHQTLPLPQRQQRGAALPSSTSSRSVPQAAPFRPGPSLSSQHPPPPPPPPPGPPPSQTPHQPALPSHGPPTDAPRGSSLPHPSTSSAPPSIIPQSPAAHPSTPSASSHPHPLSPSAMQQQQQQQLHPHFITPYPTANPPFVLTHPHFIPQYHPSSSGGMMMVMMPPVAPPLHPYAQPPHMATHPSTPSLKTPLFSKAPPPTKASTLSAAAAPFVPKATVRAAHGPPQQRPQQQQQGPMAYPPPTFQPHPRPQPGGRTLNLSQQHHQQQQQQQHNPDASIASLHHRRDRAERPAGPAGGATSSRKHQRGARDPREPHLERASYGRQHQLQAGRLEAPPPHHQQPPHLHPKAHKKQQQQAELQRHPHPYHAIQAAHAMPLQSSTPPPLNPQAPPPELHAPPSTAAPASPAPTSPPHPCPSALPAAAAGAPPCSRSDSSPTSTSTDPTPPPTSTSASSSETLPDAPVAAAAAHPTDIPAPPPLPLATRPRPAAHAAISRELLPSNPPTPASKQTPPPPSSPLPWSPADLPAATTPPTPRPSASSAPAPPQASGSPVAAAAARARSTPSWSSIAKPKDAPMPMPAASSPRALPPDVPTPTPPSQITARISDTWKQRLQSAAKPAATTAATAAADSAQATTSSQPRALPRQQQQQQQAGGDGRDSPTTTQGGRTRPAGFKPPRKADDAAALLPPAASQGPTRVLRIGGVTFEGLDERVRGLRLVRGLINDEGQYNCFLNVIIQSLWHLRCFRQAIAAVPMGALETRGGPHADMAVLKAVCSIFRALSAEPTLREVEDAAGAAAPEAPAAESAAALRDLASSGWVVDAAELREALSGLDSSSAAVAIQMSEMHDATEVLGEVFNCLHRAELGRTLDGASDLQLPQRVMVRKDSQAIAAAAPANGVARPPQQQAAYANGSHGGASNAAANGSAPPRSQLPATRSFVHQLFGLDVQVACPPSDDEGEGDKPQRRSRTKKEAAAAAAVAAAAAAEASMGGAGSPPPSATKKAKEAGMQEVQQYMKYFHLVPAQGLRQAHDTLFDCSFEEVLREADAAETLHQRLTSNGGGPQAPTVALLRSPRVFTLAIVWESPQAPLDAIKGTVSALGVRLDLASVYTGSSRPRNYSLRSVVCYFGHHYQSFALSEELQQWLLFDDTVVKLVGSWQDVARTMISARLQPSLLFYEATSPSS